jgi:hypothetical protein
MSKPDSYQPYETATEEAVVAIRMWSTEFRERAKRAQRPWNFFAVADELDRAAELLEGQTEGQAERQAEGLEPGIPKP